MDPVKREIAIKFLEFLLHDPEVARLKNELHMREQALSRRGDPLRYGYARLWWIIEVAQEQD